MPVTYTFQDKLFLVHCEDFTPIQEVKDALREGLARPDCPRPPALLIDVSRSTSLPGRPTEEIRDMARFLAERADSVGGRCAVVASSDVTFGLIRMGSVHSQDSGLVTSVFRSMPEAREWLGLPSDSNDLDPPQIR